MYEYTFVSNDFQRVVCICSHGIREPLNENSTIFFNIGQSNFINLSVVGADA